MNIEEARGLAREGKCRDCKGTHYGAHECGMENDCEDFKKEVEETIRDEDIRLAKLKKLNPFRDVDTERIKKDLEKLKQEVEDAELTLRVCPGEINLMEEELENRKDPEHERFECSASPECKCEDCQKENVKMD